MSDGVSRRARKGRDKFLAQVQVGDRYRSKTFDTYDDAKKWHDKKKAELQGDTEALEAPKSTKDTSLKKGCEWGLAILEARKSAPDRPPNDKNLMSKLRWWTRQDEVSDISLAALNRFHLEEAIAGAEVEGDGGVQTQIHRINAISWLYRAWKDEYRIEDRQLPTPADGARPPQPDGRTRRCKDATAAMGVGERDEEAFVLAEAAKSSRRWLAPAIIIAIDTAIRQAELVALAWPDIVLDGPTPHIALRGETTKSGKPRTVPIKGRTIDAFRELKAQEEATNLNGKNRSLKKPLPIETTRGVLHAWADLVGDARARAIENGASPDDAAEILDNLYWHDFRHEGVSRLFERWKLTDMEIKEIAGHESLQTTAIYTHLRGANIKLEARDPAPTANVHETEDEPGTVKLTESGTVVLTVKGLWVPLEEANSLTRNHAAELIRAAAAALDVELLAVS